MMDIRKIVRRIDRLKPMPQAARKIMAVAQNPRSSMSEIAEIIRYDQALTANLLRVCNSAFFGFSRKVESLQQAVVYLGMDQVVDLVFMSGGAVNLKAVQEGYDLAAGDLWKYSVSAALIARELAERKLGDRAHLIFTAALVKDIGKVVLNQYVADSFDKIAFLVEEKGFSFKEAEKEVLGIDHAELGGLVAEKWNFSPKMVEIIRYHHSPGESKEALIETSVVHLADTLCMMMGLGVGSDGLSYRFDNDVKKLLDFSEKDLQEVIASFGDQLQKVENLIEAT